MRDPEPVRIGCVKYLNALPLIHRWPHPVVFDHPSDLCEQLATSKLDVALVSSFEFLRRPVYTIVDDVCVASDGPVHSVFLAHAGELNEIEEIEFPVESQTGVNLLRCLLAEERLTPNLVPRVPGINREVTRCFAKFFIGDDAIRFRELNSSVFKFWDLGEAWKDHNRLPFVYALWLIRPEFSFPDQLADALRQCRDANIRDLDCLVATQRNFSSKFCHFYLRECLSYRLGRAEREGLARFRTLCEKHRLLPPLQT